jgi:hypothetical protein
MDRLTDTVGLSGARACLPRGTGAPVGVSGCPGVGGSLRLGFRSHDFRSHDGQPTWLTLVLPPLFTATTGIATTLALSLRYGPPIGSVHGQSRRLDASQARPRHVLRVVGSS